MWRCRQRRHRQRLLLRQDGRHNSPVGYTAWSQRCSSQHWSRPSTSWKSQRSSCESLTNWNIYALLIRNIRKDNQWLNHNRLEDSKSKQYSIQLATYPDHSPSVFPSIATAAWPLPPASLDCEAIPSLAMLFRVEEWQYSTLEEPASETCPSGHEIGA